ncbi:hypothetical protein P3T36_006874 [Kitasatospora sp. MAP12-15]|uniref:hypothetical protein n=1 Tax=unclassified Kitasatospora TaxID=2633591 RepID=UPI0024769995|nr:hypothetical protein [Kitasatospora sp. MAP12-44]MDH6111943.1 hypothetical protein [Kitasatospora sp. MAP12-44]
MTTLGGAISVAVLAAPVAAAVAIAHWPSAEQRAHRRRIHAARQARQQRLAHLPAQHSPEA